MIRAYLFLVPVVCFLAIGLSSTHAATAHRSDPLIERGRYLVASTGCNDCHTAGWRESDGNIPVSQWMTGSNIGLRGAAGTSYPANVRLWFQETDEQQWIFATQTRSALLQMHWHDIRFLAMSDRRAIYRFIHSLGPAGHVAPSYLPPWREPQTPYINLLPQTPAPANAK
jgi:hypothetical protein